MDLHACRAQCLRCYYVCTGVFGPDDLTVSKALEVETRLQVNSSGQVSFRKRLHSVWLQIVDCRVPFPDKACAQKPCRQHKQTNWAERAAKCGSSKRNVCVCGWKGTRISTLAVWANAFLSKRTDFHNKIVHHLDSHSDVFVSMMKSTTMCSVSESKTGLDNAKNSTLQPKLTNFTTLSLSDLSPMSNSCWVFQMFYWLSVIATSKIQRSYHKINQAWWLLLDVLGVLLDRLVGTFIYVWRQELRFCVVSFASRPFALDLKFISTLRFVSRRDTIQVETHCRSSWKGSAQAPSDDPCNGWQPNQGTRQRMGQTWLWVPYLLRLVTDVVSHTVQMWCVALSVNSG